MKTMRTALVRGQEGNLHIKRYDDYESQKAFAEDLRGNGYKVLKIWNGNIDDATVDGWELMNRQDHFKDESRKVAITAADEVNEGAELVIDNYAATPEAQEAVIQSEEDFAGIIRFEVGKVYRSIESKGEYRVVERKSTEYGDTQLAVEEADGRMYHTAFIHVVDGVETVKHLYYRCEVLKADDVVEQPTPQVDEPVEKVILDKIACTIAYSEKIGNRRAINSIYDFVKEAETKGLIDLAREVKFKTITACWSDSLDNFYIEDYLRMLA